MIKKVADNVAGHCGIIMNKGRARELGVENGDWVEVRSPVGAVQRNVYLRQGIRTDTLLMIGQFGHWKTSVAKDMHISSMNPLVPMLMDTTDATGSGADIVKISIKKIGSRKPTERT